MAEFLFFPVTAALAVMLLASTGMVKTGFLRPQGSFQAMKILYCSGAVFAGFSGVVLILYEMPHTNWEEKKRMPALVRGLAITLLFLVAAFVVALGVLGEDSLLRLSWPILTLMSSASLPGDFLQRWDAIFLSFLLFSLLFGCGTSSHFMKRIAGEIFPQKKKDHLLLGMLVITLALVLLAGNFENAELLFTRWTIGCLIPLMAVIPIFLIILERIKRKCES